MMCFCRISHGSMKVSLTPSLHLKVAQLPSVWSFLERLRWILATQATLGNRPLSCESDSCETGTPNKPNAADLLPPLRLVGHYGLQITTVKPCCVLHTDLGSWPIPGNQGAVFMIKYSGSQPILPPVTYNQKFSYM